MLGALVTAHRLHTVAGTVGDRGAALRQALAARGRRRRRTGGGERRPRARGTGQRRPGRAAGPHPRHRAALRRLRREQRTARAAADPAAGVDGRAAHRHHPDARVRRVGRRVAGRRAHADRRARRLPRRAVGVPVGLRGQPAHPRARHRRRPAARAPSDLLPPDLARRLLALAGTDPVTALPSRRIAGRDAAGLRVTPTDPQTTVGSVDIWADPTTALPLRVEVAGRTGPPLLTTELLEVTDGPPDPALLRPLAPPGAGNVTAEVIDVAGRAQGAERAPAARRASSAGPGSRCRARRCPASASTARAWPRSCSCPPAATSPSAPSTRPPPRAGSPSRVPTGRAARVSTPAAVGGRAHPRPVRLAAARRGRPDRAGPRDRRAARAAADVTVIETEGLTKRFRSVVAVDGVSLSVPTGARFGLLGPNGSGKTTLVRMLLGLVHPTAGRVALLGRPMPRDAAHVLPRVGALVEGPAAWPHLSGRANLRLLDAAGRSGRRDRADRVEEALVRVGLGGIDGRPVRAYSLGMRQRLGIAAALLRKPELLLLDEPTQRPRPPRHRRDARAAAALRGAGHDGGAVQPPAQRGRGALHAGGRDERRTAGAHRGPRRPARPDRAGAGAHARPGGGGGRARRTGRAPRRRAADGARRRPGRAERPAGRGGRGGARADGAAAQPWSRWCWS